MLNTTIKESGNRDIRIDDGNIVFRQAALDDVAKIEQLEKDVWGENGADAGKIISRIKTFPKGNVIAELGNDVVGYLSFEYVDDVTSASNFTWADITDDGKIINSHRSDGEYFYGINLSAHHLVQGKNLSTALVLRGWANMILDNKKGAFVGSRIPGFKNYKKAHPEVTAEEYIKIRRRGKLRDSELRLYEQEGLLPVKILTNYFPDADSLNFGVLVYRKNPFYNWPFRRLWAWMITSMAPGFIRRYIATKQGVSKCLNSLLG